MGQERILAEHIDGLERSDFCDFDKPHQRAYHKEKIESNEQSKEGASQNEFMEKSGMPDKVESFRESMVARIVRVPSLGLLNSSEIG